LTFSSRALSMSQMRAFLGEDVVNDLFPTFPVNNEPIISKDTKWDFEYNSIDPPVGNFEPKGVIYDHKSDRDPGIGSNNWAISGSKTASGAAMLSTDPHLTLSLPSIWYEVHLNAPGINVYGISLPGVPSVIMGFNENIAWGNT